MTREEAQIILQSYRPDDQDAADPVFAEAMELLAQDADLQAWFEQEKAFDRAMQQHVGSIQPPAGLKDQILAGMRATAAADPREDNIVDFQTQAEGSTPRKSIFSQWIPMAAAAAVLIAIGASLPTFLGDNETNIDRGDVPQLIAYLSDNYSSGISLDRKSRDVGELQAFLARQNVAVAREIPPGLIEMSPIGCKAIQFEDALIGMMCFKEGSVVYHLFTTNLEGLADILPNVTIEEMPVYYADGKNAYKVWTDNENVNILSRKGDVEQLKSFY